MSPGGPPLSQFFGKNASVGGLLGGSSLPGADVAPTPVTSANRYAAPAPPLSAPTSRGLLTPVGGNLTKAISSYGQVPGATYDEINRQQKSDRQLDTKTPRGYYGLANDIAPPGSTNRDAAKWVARDAYNASMTSRGQQPQPMTWADDVPTGPSWLRPALDDARFTLPGSEYNQYYEPNQAEFIGRLDPVARARQGWFSALGNENMPTEDLNTLMAKMENRHRRMSDGAESLGFEPLPALFNYGSSRFNKPQPNYGLLSPATVGR